VVTASAFQSEMTVGSPAAPAGAAITVAVPMARVVKMAAAASAASQLRICACRRRVDNATTLMGICASPAFT
jgi:hypothetical protein